jgi:hypothetical protein
MPLESPIQLIPDARVADSISAASCWSVGGYGTAPPGSVAWPTANLAIYVPFRVPVAIVAYKIACGTGAATTGNFDLGIYNAAGTRLVSTGSTAKTTANSDRVIDITDTTLIPGMYYFAMAVDTLSAAYQGWTAPNVGYLNLLGCRQQASAFALPNPATFETITGTVFTAVSIYLRSD